MNEKACIIFSVVNNDMSLMMKLAEDASADEIGNFIQIAQIIIGTNEGLRNIFISQLPTLGKHADTVLKYIRLPKNKRPPAITPFEVLKGN